MFSLIKAYIWYFCVLPVIVIIAICVEYWQFVTVMGVLAIAAWYIGYKLNVDLWWDYKAKCDGSHTSYHADHKRSYEKKKAYRKLGVPAVMEDLHEKGLYKPYDRLKEEHKTVCPIRAKKAGFMVVE